MARDLVLAVDEGTTGVTCILLDAEGRRLGHAYSEVHVSTPKPGWVEQDAMQLWSATLATARETLKAAGVPASRVAALGIANQRETTVVWDGKSGLPLAPAIVWQDRRTAARCRELKGREASIRKRTGLVVDPYFCATKLEWLLANVPKVRKSATEGRLRFGTVDSWLLWNLTGGKAHATDVTNASRTLLLDLRKGTWDTDLLDTFGVPQSCLPDVTPSACALGETIPSALGAVVPVGSMVGDQQAALFGQGCVQRGQAKNTYGTGCFLLQHTGDAPTASKHGLLSTRAASTDKTAKFALEGSVFTGGALIQWLRDGLGMLRSASDVDTLAALVPDSGGVQIVPAFTGLGAPHWDPEARGMVVGLTRGTDQRHLARASLESIALQTCDLLDAMALDTGARLRALRVDGGAAKSTVLLQMQADLLQAPVERPADVETTARGAGLLAGITAGLWTARDAARQGEFQRFEPKMDANDASARRTAWLHAVAACRSYAAALGATAREEAAGHGPKSAPDGRGAKRKPSARSDELPSGDSRARQGRPAVGVRRGTSPTRRASVR